MIQLYYSFVFPYVHYCNLAWGNAADSTLWPIYKNQKIALRIISNTPRRGSTRNFCQTHQILRLPQIHQNAIGLFMFKFKHNQLPPIFSRFFSTNQEQHSHNTRNATNFRNPLMKTQIGSKFITSTGVNFWNRLDHAITSKLKIGPFKRLLRTHIVNC